MLEILFGVFMIFMAILLSIIPIILGGIMMLLLIIIILPILIPILMITFWQVSLITLAGIVIGKQGFNKPLIGAIIGFLIGLIVIHM